MRVALLLLVGFACAQHGQRTASRLLEARAAAEQHASQPGGVVSHLRSAYEEKIVNRQLRVLGMLLLAFNSTVAFNPSGVGGGVYFKFAKSIIQLTAHTADVGRIQTVQCNADSLSVIDVQDVLGENEELLAERIAQVVNWAYRGKDEVEDSNAWTGERHLLSGIRTDAAEVLEMLRMGRDSGPTRRALFLAMSGESDNKGVSSCIGTIQVERSEDGTEAEIGLFSVDPDVQSQGIGSSLLRKAEQHAAQVMGARLAVLWVITLRSDILQWYERCGYEKTGQTAPFPTEANVGKPLQDAPLEFVRLEKLLS